MRRSPTPDLEALVSAQLERDQRIEPFMRERKCTRMRVSPHAFLRGTAALFYDLVRERGRVATFPSAKGGLCGDLHLENFGVFRTNRPKKDRSHLVFDVNDFDDATEGPFVLDLLRLLTSLLLAVRAPLPDGEARLSLAKVCSNAYARAIVRGGGSAKRTPKVVLRLMARAAKRRAEDIAKGRTKGRGASAHFVLDGVRYRPLPKSLATAARLAFDDYARVTAQADGAPMTEYEVLDVAERIAGTGSLGVLRVAVLTRGKGRAPWLFEMKEEKGNPSSATISQRSRKRTSRGAERVAGALRLSGGGIPEGLGIARLEQRSLLVRRLCPQEDKLSTTDLPPRELVELAPFLFEVAGRMHRRTAKKKDTKAMASFLETHGDSLISEASELAGLHEALHLLYFQRAR